MHRYTTTHTHTEIPFLVEEIRFTDSTNPTILHGGVFTDLKMCQINFLEFDLHIDSQTWLLCLFQGIYLQLL